MPDVVARDAAAVCDYWLSECHAALSACVDSAPIDAAFVAVGQIAWDSCCGVLAVAPERTYRSASFPIEGSTDDECEIGLLVVDIVVLLLRCVPTVDDRGKAPAPAALDAAHKAILNDAAVIWNTVIAELPEGWQRSNVDQQYIGAQGGCIGVETRLSVGLAQSVWCPECLEAP